MPIREKLDRAAKSNGARDLKRQAEDEITAEDRRKFEAAQKIMNMCSVRCRKEGWVGLHIHND